jgi:hypothetical protein
LGAGSAGGGGAVTTGGGGGSGGSSGSSVVIGVNYGGGGGGLGFDAGAPTGNTTAGLSAVRIIWAGGTGITRAFPSTNTGNL